MRYVLIGNSIACVGAVEGIRANDKEGRITIVGKEKYPVYSRPLISYYLQGKVKERNLFYKTEAFYKDNGCEAMLGTEALSIDASRKTVKLSDGSVVPYDKLLVATGSSPFVPPMNGLEKVAIKHTFYTLDDARALQESVNQNSKVLIIGCGLIGLKCAECLKDLVNKITMVDFAEKILPACLDGKASGMVKLNLEENGIEVLLGTSVKEFEANSATLTNGKEVDFDAVVLAVGVRPNVSLVKDAGGAVGRGIVVDERMRTSLADVYAAGDCVENTDCVFGGCRVLALFPSAFTGGRVAGINMSGGNAANGMDFAVNSTKLFGQSIMTAGCMSGEQLETESTGYKALFVQDNKLKGYIIIDDIERAGIYTALIRNGTDLSTVDFEMLQRKPGLLAFDKEVRQSILGGEV
ncbi:MAG: FAD-dependent oxidoreductase [Clostridia bacterium]|nr:FAD-dependent oxidoreductase [Clostridia bacterium]